ncbi:MAG: Ribosome-binding factor A [bacterium ADurb.Bin157]|jgi:ribosome-binding factor A|nr:MAG: Ribosome-binding factor A [bacterium ADurb.Bin157]
MSRRQERVSELLLRELSTLIYQKVSDPRVRGVHIVNVDISPDFHLARVLYSFLDNGHDAETVQKGLDSAKPFLRKELKKVLLLRVLPELAFFYDPSIKQGDNLLELLRNIHVSDS